jgi:hypothetical protein
MRSRAALLVAALALSACAARSQQPGAASDAAPAAACDAAARFSFVPDTGESAEAYLCFGYDAGAIGALTIAGVSWTPPAPGPFILHHAKLYAVPGDFPDGPVPCDGMPDGSIGLDVWAPGTGELVLPADTGLVLPAGTRRLVVEAHTLRVGSGDPQPAAVALCAGPAAPANLAGLMRTGAPVPAIRPHHEETSSGTCRLGGDLHLWSVWPHMHLTGEEITVDLLAAGTATLDGGPTTLEAGTTTTLVDVVPWNFLAQKRYPLSVDAHAGDEIGVTCKWNNTSDNYVFPGPLTENEMCNAAFIAWPAASATCAVELP